MTERILAAREFAMVFEAVSTFRSRAAALADPRVQAARRRYRLACRSSEMLAIAA